MANTPNTPAAHTPSPVPEAAPAAPAALAATPVHPLAAEFGVSEDQAIALQAALASRPERFAALAAPHATTNPRPRSIRQVSLEVADLVSRGGSAAEVKLALQDVVPADDAGNGALRDDWRGELWAANNDRRPIIDALGTPSPLQTGSKVKGYEWEVLPDVQTYDGNKKPVPSNKPKTKAVETSVHRSAGGWDIDRIFFDLGDPAFLESFWRAAVADYKMDAETYAAQQILGYASDKGASASFLAALGATGADFAKVGASLDHIFIAPDLFETYTAMTQAEVPFWLANAAGISLRTGSATVGDLSIQTHTSLADGQILAFDTRAAEWFEASPPIKVQAIDLAKGGIDIGVFGYDALLPNDRRAIVKRAVTPKP